MKKSILKILSTIVLFTMLLTSCGQDKMEDGTANIEQKHTEKNQQHLNDVQPAPDVTWSLERDNLIKRAKLQNDRSVMMYMYVFIEGVGTPIGYYQVNKVSSVNHSVLSSPAEDGSYGTNGDAIFGFTPDALYIEHNMKYITATAPLAFKDVPMIGKISIEVANQLKSKISAIEKEVYK